MKLAHSIATNSGVYQELAQELAAKARQVQEQKSRENGGNFGAGGIGGSFAQGSGGFGLGGQDAGQEIGEDEFSDSDDDEMGEGSENMGGYSRANAVPSKPKFLKRNDLRYPKEEVY